MKVKALCKYERETILLNFELEETVEEVTNKVVNCFSTIFTFLESQASFTLHLLIEAQEIRLLPFQKLEDLVDEGVKKITLKLGTLKTLKNGPFHC